MGHTYRLISNNCIHFSAAFGQQLGYEAKTQRTAGFRGPTNKQSQVPTTEAFGRGGGSQVGLWLGQQRQRPSYWALSDLFVGSRTPQAVGTQAAILKPARCQQPWSKSFQQLILNAATNPSNKPCHGSRPGEAALAKVNGLSSGGNAMIRHLAKVKQGFWNSLAESFNLISFFMFLQCACLRLEVYLQFLSIFHSFDLYLVTSATKPHYA